MIQLSHLYMTTGKNLALPIQTFVRKVMFLLFNVLSRFVVAFLPRKKKKRIKYTLIEEINVREEEDVVAGGLESCRKASWRWEDLI